MALTPRLDQRLGQALVMTPQLQQAIKLLQLSNIELAEFVEQELERNPMLEREESDRLDAGEGPGTEAIDVDGGGGEPVDGAESGDTDVAGGDAFDDAISLDGLDDGAPGTDGGLSSVDFGDSGDGGPEFGDMDVAVDDLYINDGAPDAVAAPADDGYQPSLPITGGGGGFDDDLPGYEQTLRQEVSLRDHLTEQLTVDTQDQTERVIGAYLIDMLDESGYLAGDLAAVGAALGCDAALVEAVLARVQQFDPPGIFARDLKECLALQLADRDRLDPAMQALLENLDMLAKRDLKGLMRVCGVDAEDLADMIGEIRALDPKPALAFDGDVAQPVIPDVLMRATRSGGWHIELNSETLPRVLVNNQYYVEINKAVSRKEDKQYVTEQYQSANWLVKSLHQRATTILKVAKEIVRQQDEFFAKGIQYLKPLVLRDIAEAIDMHESTVSRVTANKFIATPRGLFELKYFFTSSISSADGGEAHSAEAVRHRIRGLIDNEPPTKILSDDKIVDLLRADGIDIARRTVAKYREAMGISSSVQRRREKSSAF